MNKKAMLGCRLGLLLTILWVCWAPGQSSPHEDHPPSTAAPMAPSGVDGDRWQRLVAQLRANGMTIESTQECLAPVREATRQGLPADCVLTRVEEGAAKRVAAKLLQEAARQRLLNLQSAAELLRQAGYDDRTPAYALLIRSVTLALESVISANTLQRVLAHANGTQPERMQSIVEAGETMRLGGMDESTVQQIMIDFTDRNMRRTEIIRASRFAIQRHRTHMNGDRIRQQLWKGTEAAGRGGNGVQAPDAAGSGHDVDGSWRRNLDPPGTGGVGPSPGNHSDEATQSPRTSPSDNSGGSADAPKGGRNTQPSGSTHPNRNR